MMRIAPKRRWLAFVDSLRLSKRLEFNPGDVGIPGALQIKEQANLNPTTTDMIKRFGGSTSPESPWPRDETAGDEGDDQFDKLEKLLQKLMRTGSGGKRGAGGAGDGTGTGSGSGTGTGTGTMQDDSG